MDKDAILGYECRHAVYVEAQDRSPSDLVAVKEVIHFKDGTTEPHLRLIENYKRHFWVTRELHRNHKDKKEWELESKLQRFTSTQVDLVKNAAKALGQPVPMNGQLRMLARSPYIYGCDISTPALIKKHYLDKFPTLVTPNTVAVSDTETDVLDPDVKRGNEKIIMQSITMKDKVHLVIVKDFFEGWDLSKLPDQLQAAMQRYMGDVVARRNITLTVSLVNHRGDVAQEILQKAHEWKPDFLTFWNMDFDITAMERALLAGGYDPAKEWSDPSVPRKYQYYHYKQGQTQKRTASGKTMPLTPAEQWHHVTAPASFFVIDSMCVYQRLRVAKGKKSSYALNAILAEELEDVQKMHFEETAHLTGTDWHREMQRNYKLEYCIYNIFDCVSVEILEEKTQDLTVQISSQCGHSEYRTFPSQPRRTCDDLHFETLNHDPKYVCATTSDQMIDDNDSTLIGHNKWIVALRADLQHDMGIDCIEEMPGFKTLIRDDTADLDLAGTYPSEEVIFNIGKQTTAREISHVVGVSEALQRATGINLSGGYVNAVEIYTTVFKAPTFDQLLSYHRGEDPLPPEFDDHLRQLMSTMEAIEEFVEDVDDESEDEAY